MIYTLLLMLLKCFNEGGCDWSDISLDKKKMFIRKSVEEDQLGKQRQRSKDRIKIGFQVYNFR
jgi:hypothetical protein